MARQRPRRQHRRDPDRLRAWPWVHFFAWFVLSVSWIVTWAQDGGTFWPIFPIGGWAIGLFSHFRQVQRHNEEVRLRLAQGVTPPVPATQADPTPVHAERGSTAESAGPSTPSALAPTADEVRRITRALSASGRGQLAESLEMGLLEATRLARLREQIGDIDVSLAEARAEIVDLEGRAERTTDADARATWSQSAEAASRRVEKIEALRAEDERAAARIESFRQLVKSVGVDVTRHTLTELHETASLSDLADQAHRVDREVEALHRTSEELRQLAAARRGQRG
jgi:hypothetical protein